MKTPSTAERIKQLLSYNPDTGQFIWENPTANNVKKGQAAGAYDSDGYRKIMIDRNLQFAHRLAWTVFYGEPPTERIDHINGVKDDNRISNLCLTTISENIRNQKRAHSDSKTGLLGVNLDKQTGKFRATIFADKRKHHLGFFQTKEEASAAYWNAKQILHSDVMDRM